MRIEAAKDYLVSVAERTIGRAAWRKAMQQPKPLYAFYEFAYPVTHRLVVSTLETPECQSLLYFAKLAATIPVDIALLIPTILSLHNPAEAAVIKLATNAAVHMGLDAASAVANRIRAHRSSGTTLAV